MQTAQINRPNNKMIKVGFDLDGVILYNPARIIRPFISLYKKMFLKRKKLHFYCPKSLFEKIIWRFLHRSSIYQAPGLDEIQKLVEKGKLKAFIVTARYDFMGRELLKWYKKNKLDRIFTEMYYNKRNEQPHVFKERMIKKLGLNFFVEDNFDIVQHTGRKTSASIIWIYNLFDRGIPYPYKFPYLKKAVQYIKEEIGKIKNKKVKK